MEITQVVNPFVNIGAGSGNGSRVIIVVFIVVAIAGIFLYFKNQNTSI